MSFTKEEKNGNIRLQVEGSMSINEVAALREELFACLENSAGLELDLGGVTACDAAGLQLLYAARKTAEEGERGFRIAGASHTVLEILQSAGLNPDDILNSEVVE